MSHFYADIQGNRGEATRGGTKGSGIAGHIRGWSTGARVSVDYNEDTGKDVVRVYRTGGSNHGSGELIAEWSTDYYRPVIKKCENVLQGEACEECPNRFKCFTKRE